MDNPPAIIQEYVGGQCGGGYTDKYGLSWGWTVPYPNCWYEPFLKEGNFSSGELEPPKDEDILYFKGMTSPEIIKILAERARREKE